MSIYERYKNYVSNIKNDLSNFKNHSDFTYMLEHVSFESGNDIFNVLINELNFDIDIIKKIVEKNDSIGNPKKYIFHEKIYCSPTSLRYIYHAHMILNSIKTNEIDIIEIGGGYGGLCLVIYMLSKYYNINIKSYNIIDLKEVTLLQENYLKMHDINVKTYNSENFGKDIEITNAFLISTYAFSELEKYIQEKYIENLFFKIKHGFFVWNYIPVYNFGFNIKIENEYPVIDKDCDNKFIFF